MVITPSVRLASGYGLAPDEFSITGIHLDANFSGQSRISSSAISSRPVNENGLVIRWDINLGSTDEQKMVRPSARPVIPLDFYPLIGQIIMTRGAFEEMFTKFTGALVVSTAHDIKTDIERLNFKRKKELCRKLITKQFYESEKY